MDQVVLPQPPKVQTLHRLTVVAVAICHLLRVRMLRLRVAQARVLLHRTLRFHRLALRLPLRLLAPLWVTRRLPLPRRLLRLPILQCCRLNIRSFRQRN